MFFLVFPLKVASIFLDQLCSVACLVNQTQIVIISIIFGYTRVSFKGVPLFVPYMCKSWGSTKILCRPPGLDRSPPGRAGCIIKRIKLTPKILLLVREAFLILELFCKIPIKSKCWQSCYLVMSEAHNPYIIVLILVDILANNYLFAIKI